MGQRYESIEDYHEQQWMSRFDEDQNGLELLVDHISDVYKKARRNSTRSRNARRAAAQSLRNAI